LFTQEVALVQFATIAALLGVAMLSTGPVVAAKQGKTTVCHLDATTGIISPISVSTASSHIPHGDRLYDATLSGATIYTNAWTELDGIPGYSGCDQRIQTLVEASGDSAPNAGDAVLYGKYPTALTAPYGFSAFPFTSRTIAAYCGDLTAGAVAWFNAYLDFDDWATWGPDERDRATTTQTVNHIPTFSSDVTDDNEAAPYDKNTIRILVNGSYVVNMQAVSPTDDPLIDVVINSPC
jgi:hypothetical protein